MKKFSVEIDGRVYQIDGPENSTQQQAEAAVRRRLQTQQAQPAQRAPLGQRLRESFEQQQVPVTPRKSTIPEEFMRTLRGQVSSGRTGIAAIFGDAEEQAREGIERSQAISEDYGTTPSLEELQEVFREYGLLEAAKELGGQIPRYVSQMAPTLLQGLAGAKAGAMIPGPPQLKAAGAVAGGIGAFVPSFAGSNIERRAEEQIEAQEDVDVDVARAYGVAAAQSGMQAVGGAVVLGKRALSSLLGKDMTKLSKEATEESLKALADRGMLQNMARRGVAGIAGEVPTEVAQQALERYYAGLPMADDEALKEYGEAAYASVLGGGAIGATTGIGERSANVANLEAFQTAQRTAIVPVSDFAGVENVTARVIVDPETGSVKSVFESADNQVIATDEFSGDEAQRVFAWFKDKEAKGEPVTNESIKEQGFKADEPVAETEVEVTAADTPVTEEMRKAAAEMDVRPEPEGISPKELRAQIEAQMQTMGVTITPDQMRNLMSFAGRKNEADRPKAIEGQLKKHGKPTAPAKPAAPAVTETPTGVTPPSSWVADNAKATVDRFRMTNPLVLDLVTRLHAEDKTAQEIASELMSRGVLSNVDLDTIRALRIGLGLPSQGKASGSATVIIPADAAERQVFETWRDAYYKKAADEKQKFKTLREERVKQENSSTETASTPAGTTDSTRFDEATITRELKQHQLTIKTEIEAEAARRGVTLTPKDLKNAVITVSNNTFRLKSADLSNAVVEQVIKYGKPITPTPAAAPTVTETPTEPAPAVTETPAEPEIKRITKEDLDNLGIAPQAAIRRNDRVIGRTIEEARSEFENFLNNRSVKEKPGLTKKIKDFIGKTKEREIEEDRDPAQIRLKREATKTSIAGRDALRSALRGTPVGKNKAADVARKYFNNRVGDGLTYMAYDVINSGPEYNPLKGENVDTSKGPQPTQKHKDIAAAVEWVKGNLDAETKKAFDDKIAYYKNLFAKIEENVDDTSQIQAREKAAREKEVREYQDAIREKEQEEERERTKPKKFTEQEIREYENNMDYNGVVVLLKMQQSVDTNVVTRAARRKSNQVAHLGDSLIEAAHNMTEDYQDILVRKQDMMEKISELQSDPTFTLLLENDVVSVSSMPLSDVQMAIAEGGDLKGTLQSIIGNTENTEVKSLAKALLNNLGDTKLEVVDNLKDSRGNVVAGLFDPQTNTIKINRAYAGSHPIMHETTHALTDATLSNKSHPVTKALTKLYEEVKSRLPSEYGAQSLKEFVAEAFSNQEFRSALATIKVPSNEKQTVFQRFKNIIGNLLRQLMGKPRIDMNAETDALTQTDALIRNILAPAPAYRSGPELRMAIANNPESVLSSFMSPFKKSGEKIDPRIVENVMASLAPLNRKKVQMFAQLLPLNAQTEIAEKIIPSAKKLIPLLQLKNGYRANKAQAVRDLSAVLNRVFKGKPTQREIFNQTVAYSTIVKVDPSLSEAAAIERYGKTADGAKDPNSQKMQDYRRLRSEYWNKLSDKEQAAYEDLRNYYAKEYEQIRALVKKRIDEFATNPDMKRELNLKLLDEVLNKEAIEPYFPLSRSGEHWLEYRAVDPFTDTVEMYKHSFDSEAERNRAKIVVDNDKQRLKELADRGIKTETDSRIYDRAKTTAELEKVPTSFAYKILTEVRKIGAPAEVEKMVVDMLLNAMPENSMARMFRPRAGTRGFETDAIQVLQDRSSNINVQMANLTYDGELSKLSEQMSEEAKKSSDPHANVWLTEFKSYIDYSRSPFIPSWSRRLKGLGFLYTLGFNASSVFVNATNPAVVTYPYLGGMFGYGKASAAMLQAGKLYMGATDKSKYPLISKRKSSYDFEFLKNFDQIDNKDGIALDFTGGPSPSNFDYSDLSKVPKEYHYLDELNKAMVARGQSNRSLLMEVNEFNADNIWSRFLNLSGLAFHQGERFNRWVSATAAYNLKLEEMAKGQPISTLTREQKAEAADFAIDVAELTNSGAMAETAPKISQGPIGSVLFMYKRFGMSMLYLQARLFKEAFMASNLTRQEKQIARRQLVGLFGTSALLAGVQGVPLYGVVSMIMNALRDDDEEDFDTEMSRVMGEPAFSGMLNYITGADIAPRIAMTNLLFRNQPNRSTENFYQTIGEYVAGPVGGIGNRIFNGMNYILDGEIRRGSEQIMPAAFSNVAKSLRYYQEGATTLRGDPIVEDIGPGQIAGQVFGFAPAGYTRQLERNAMNKRIDRKISENKTKLLRKYYMAYRQNDIVEMMRVREEMREFSNRHPSSAITADTIEASVRQHKVTDEMARQLGGITVSRRRFAEVLEQNMRDGF